jgi:type I restriction enzyme S subunit
MKTNPAPKNTMEIFPEIHFEELYDTPSRNGVSKPSKIRGGGYKMINMGELFRHDIITDEIVTEYVPLSESEKSNAFLKSGDLLFARQSLVLEGVGKCSIFSGSSSDTTFESHLIRVRLKKGVGNPKFYFYYYFSHLGKSKISANASKLAASGIRGSDLQKIKVVHPPLPEQSRIVSVLETWDAAIEKLGKVIAAKREVKKGVMQELLTGKRRLVGFDGEWGNVKLGDCLIIRHGKPQREVESVDGKYPILGTGGEFGRADKFLYDKPSVLIGRKGTIDKPRYMDSPFWTVDTLFYSEIKKDNSAKYLYYLFLTINWKEYNEGSGVPSLSASTVSAIKVSIPKDEKEQTAIAAILTTADQEIEMLERKLLILREQKRFLLNNLITGATRTPETLTAKK